jgi:hypothetical protein
MFWAFLYNDALIVDRYGVLQVQAWGEIKNEDWRFAAGLQFNVFCPNVPTMLTFSALLASGDPGNNFVGQFRIERYLHPGDDSQWTMQFAPTVFSLSVPWGARNSGIPGAIGRAVLNMFTFQYGSSVETCGQVRHVAGFCGHSHCIKWQLGQRKSEQDCGWAGCEP